TLAQKQLSLPELIACYRRFIAQIAKTCEVVIAIDELDKIDSPEEVRSFLNETKALFGVDHCFYLIAISETAVAQFERRGFQIRDEMDSSFDKILYVDYLSLASA